MPASPSAFGFAGSSRSARRVEPQRAFDQLQRLALQRLPLQHRQGVGLVDQQLRIVGGELQRAAERAARLGPALHHRIAAAEHDPAFEVLLPARRRLLHALGQPGDHRLDLFLRRRGAGRGRLGVERGRVAEHRIEPGGDHRHRECREQHRRARRPAARRRRIGAGLVEQPARELVARAGMRVRIERAGGEVVVELAQLRLQRVEVGLRRVRAGGHAAAAQRADHDRHRHGGQRRGQHDERGHAGPDPSPSSWRSRSRSAASSGGGAVATSAPAATSSSTNGPAHSAQVLPLTGGR